MSLRTTTLCIIFSVLMVFSTIAYLTSRYVIVEGFQTIEDENARDDALRALNAMHQLVDRMDSLLVDWAHWDDTYAFIQNRNKAFIKSNLTVETLVKQHLAWVVFLTLEGKIVWGQVVDAESKTFQPLPAELLPLLPPEGGLGPKGGQIVAVKGVVMLGDTPYLVAARSILDSDGAKSPRGVCLMARKVDSTLVDDLRRTVMLNIAVAVLGAEETAGAGTGTGDQDVQLLKTPDLISSSLNVADITGRAALRLSVQDERSALTAGLKTFQINFAFLVATGGCVALAFLILLERRILRRIRLISDQTSRERTPGRAPGVIAIGGNDELTGLARAINQMAERTEANERFLQETLDAIQAGVVLICPERGVVVDANAFAVQLLGRDRQSILGVECKSLLCSPGDPCPVDHPERYNKLWTSRLLTAGGRLVPVLKSVCTVLRDGETFLLLTFIDISELEETQEALRASQGRYRTVFMNTGTACVLVDEDTRVLLANNEFIKLSGQTVERIEAGLSLAVLFAPEVARRVMEYHRLRRVSPSAAPREYETVFVDGKGRRRDVMMTVAMVPGTMHSVASILDISSLKNAQRQLEHQAYHDILTGLPNRTLLQIKLTRALDAAQAGSGMVGLLLLDLDRFKQVNDSFGHPFGDAVLSQAAARLTSVVSSGDTLARLGGDEFVLVVDRVDAPDALADLARDILSLFDKPFQIGSNSIYLSASIGIAVYPRDADAADALIKNADLAMYQSKEGGKNTFSFFNKELDAAVVSKMLLETQLYTALEDNSFRVVYQPKVDAVSNLVTGCEALVRWCKPDGTLVSPAEFVPLAEETGLIVRIDDLVLRTACRQVADWNARLDRELTVAVNLSARNFQEKCLATTVLAVLQESSLAPHLLEIEITETALMRNWDSALSTIDTLSRLGVKILLDDFGTGYCSLSYLRKLPIAAIKIDKSFVGEVDSPNPESAILVKTIIALAGNLGLSTVGEGVENLDQLRFLIKHGCTVIQGYVYSRPVNPVEFESLLRGALTPCISASE